MAKTTSELLISRQEKLRALLKDAPLDAFALNAGPSLTYFSGLHFHLMERPTVVIFTAGGETAIVLPELEQGKVADLGYPAQDFTYGEDPAKWADSFRAAATALGISKGKIGVEEEHLRVLELGYLQAGFPEAEFVNSGHVLAKVRRKKDAAEIAAMRRAAEIAEDALRATLKMVRAGVTEKQISAELVQQLFKHGSEVDLPFFPIVATGTNSANPHATVSDRQVQEGDLLLIDWGASHEGYFSDITRTFAVGEIDEELQRIYEVVKLANEAGRATAGPGVTPDKVDTETRDAIEDSGYGEYFIHRTGHGLGMEAHEQPYIRAGNEEALEPGMTFTIEPGIYIPGRGGVRIEDNVAVTEDGLETLTSFPRDLQKLG